jgi:Bacterial alpha-L-rhamnosidase C-terminal domain
MRSSSAATTRSYPCSANRAASSRPIPLEAPVTMASGLPVVSFIIILVSGRCGARPFPLVWRRNRQWLTVRRDRRLAISVTCPASTLVPPCWAIWRLDMPCRTARDRDRRADRHRPADIDHQQPVKPGHQTFTVSPHPGSLRWTEGTVPTPYGQILVRWTRDGHRFSLTVAVPARSTAFIRLPGRHVILPGGQRGTTRTFTS